MNPNIKVGSNVILSNTDSWFDGKTMIVEEVRQWGCVGYVDVNETQCASYRANWDQMSLVESEDHSKNEEGTSLDEF